MKRAFNFDAFDPLAFDVEIWGSASTQSETWTSLALPLRVFDPDIFDLTPIFDTGSASGIWTDRTKQAEVWTPL